MTGDAAVEAGDRSLVVEFIEEEFEVPVDGQLTFGRSADLVLDESNPYLHRRLGRFFHQGGTWMLENTGSQIKLTITDAQSSSRLTIDPGRLVAIPFEDCTLTFSAGRSTYQLEIEVPFLAIPLGQSDTLTGTTTVSVGDVPLTESQKQCIVALAETRLQAPHLPMSAVPSNKDASRRLGWGSTKFNRKLDNVCDKFDRAGVKGLHGGLGELAVNRREVLVDHAITHSIVTLADLELLP